MHGPRSTGTPARFHFKPGVNDVPESYLEGLSEKQLGYLIAVGTLTDLPSPEAAPEIPPVPSTPEPPPSGGFVKLPKDTDAALVAVAACSDGALLSTWFNLETARPAVSDAILERLKALDVQ